ncbi:zinc ABC transporter substrate-binding protein [Limibacter armeniacum]|uniref:metal ABC transporter solute-binding protein, Zn/Mn family n=1 Tax=Limibacter armeniacum TaxID=466084 RepID=UPI002FE537D2
MRVTNWLIVGLLTLLMAACGTTEKQKGEKLTIITTTGMIEDAVKNITGELADVEGLMGPGVDPHLYKATPSDLQKLRGADIVFYNGLHLEGSMTDVLEKFARKKAVFPLSDGLDEKKLRTPEDGSTVHDPHIWFDVELWSQAVSYAAEKIAAQDPDNATVYKTNAEKYLQQLHELNNWTRTQIQSIPSQSRVLITAHDAFGYFGSAYDIEVKGLQGISTVAEFGLKDISGLVNFIVSHKIKAVFVETSVPHKSLEAVVSGCHEKQHNISIGGTLYSDAMGALGSEAGTYIGMVKSNVNTIVSALK